ncbi:MAG: aminotransferase class III-fold pyridoxal phosphate-dependent enzyme, partial [Planctomycetota bacterium]
PDGHCRPFDSNAAGTLFSDGAGAVVLKRLDDAIRDGDHVYAVIKGTGINNDGGTKASFSAPSIDGQANAIAMAHAEAGVPVESIGYVECHGTATPIGDPIEIAGLRRVFESQTEAKQFCAIGSVKSNVGHTVAAAGVAGLIKAALALHHEQIPATLHYQKPNPQIDFEQSPFFVCDRLTEWDRTEQKRRAGISSFGVGGTNAHVLIEESPLPVSDQVPCAQNGTIPLQIFPVSATNPAALKGNLAAVSASFGEVATTDSSPARYAWTLQHGRDQFKQRAFAVAGDLAEASEKLTSKVPTECYRGEALAGGRELAFMFPGQGAQYVNMGRDLYESSAAYRTAFDECLAAMSPHTSRDLREIIFSDDSQSCDLLRETEFTQPAMFAVSYALGRMWMALGFEPKAVLGHSIGEFAAACLAGVFSLKDAAALIAKRGQSMSEVPAGTMLSVRLPGSEVEQRLQSLELDVVVATYNGPSLCVVAGHSDQVAKLQQILEAEEVACRELHTSHAFHSPMMDPIVDHFREEVAKCTLNKPSIPILSTVTADWLTDEQATDPEYWARHLRLPVQFSQAVSRLWAEQPKLALVELGPRRTLATLATQHMTDRDTQVAVATLSDTAEDHAEWRTTLTAIGQLWVSGVDVPWRALHPATRPAKVSLPSYAYQRERFFIEPPKKNQTQPVTAAQSVVSDSNQNVCLPGVSQNPEATNQTIHTATHATHSEFTKMTNTRANQIRTRSIEVLEAASGLDIAGAGDDATFFEMGMDSLVITQAANAMKKEFGVNITFRQMMEQTPNLATMVEFLDAEIAADAIVDEVVEVADSPAVQQPAAQQPTAQAVAMQPPTMPVAAFATVPASVDSNNPAAALMQQQLNIIQQQLQVLGAAPTFAPNPQAAAVNQASASSQLQAVAAAPAAKSSSNAASQNGQPENASDSDSKPKKVFGAGARVKLGPEELDASQQAALDSFIRDYNARTPKSKASAQQHRRYMADPRTVSGFRPALKEMTYPIVVTHSKGAIMWDVDGNEWLDVTCGFGSNFLGHTPDFIVETVTEQMEKGYEIGPQSPLAGEVAKLFTEITGLERMCFANTGSEAVLGATRLARTATARETVVMFHNDYHGILDEVIVRGNTTGKSFPAATGIPSEHVSNVLMLEYGSDESLRIIEERMDDLAAILVEPVQSRKPELQPKAFLQRLSEMTRNAETALIIDEVITGFRVAPGGSQQWFGIEADLATYGKVVGGGLPIGVIGGKAKYMDGLDGGFWQFGDDSQPEAGMTYFAGTFVRHPLTLAAAKATLEFIQKEGQPVYDRLNRLTDNLASRVNEIFERTGCPARFENFGSLFKVQFEEEFLWGEMLFAALRHRGIHIWDHRPCLLTVAHTEQHVDQIVKAFDESVAECLRHGFLPGDAAAIKAACATPPANARQGKDRDGNPAWFVPDASNPGQFIQLNTPV